MKNKNKSVALRTLIVGLAMIGLTAVTSLSLYSAEVVFEAKVAPAPKEGFIYKMDVPRPDFERILGMSTKVLNAAGVKVVSREALQPIEDRYALKGEEPQFSINKNGTEVYFTNFLGLKLTGKTGKLPADRDSIRYAQQFLKRVGLMPRNEAELKVDHVGGIMQMLSNSKAPEKKASVVYFFRQLDGLRVYNYGSSITVTLTESEIPVGVQVHWREVAARERVEAKAFNPAETVLKLIREDIDRVFSQKASIVIDSIDFVLYDNGENYIQPAYCYRGLRASEGKGLEPMPVMGYVPALDKTYEPIHHPAYSPCQLHPSLVEEKNKEDDK